MTAAQALRAIIGTCAADFDADLARLMICDDPEAPHGARVALRRLRSALAGFANIIDPAVLAASKADAKALFHLLGPLRDADVLAGTLAGALSGAADHPSRALVASQRRAEARAGLTARGAGQFAASLQASFATKAWQRAGRKPRKWRRGSARRQALRALDRAWRPCVRHGTSLARMSEPDRHAFRKDMKTLRYLGEFFGPLWPKKAQSRFFGRLENLQNTLGTLNDLAIAARSNDADAALKARTATRAAAALRQAEASWRSLRKAGPWWQ